MIIDQYSRLGTKKNDKIMSVDFVFQEKLIENEFSEHNINELCLRYN